MPRAAPKCPWRAITVVILHGTKVALDSKPASLETPNEFLNRDPRISNQPA